MSEQGSRGSLVHLLLPDIQELLKEGSSADIAEGLSAFHSADIADLVEMLDPADARTLLQGLDAETRVETFEQLELNHKVSLLEQLGPVEMAPIVTEMAHDDRADVMAELEPELAASLLSRLPADDAKDVALLSHYDEETAGGIMTTDYVRLSLEMSVAEAIEHVRAQATTRETVFALYVLDEGGCLAGVASLAKLILSPADAAMRDIMYANPISVPVSADQETVMRQLRHYDFLAMPVLDADGRMVGIVTHDDVLDVALEEADEDAQKMGGVQPLSQPYLATGFATLVRKRATWLTLLLFAGLAAGTILRGYEETLQRSMSLIFFLPLIIASGGNSGSQSATLIVRGLAVGEMGPRDFWRIVGRELASGLALGILLGVISIGMAFAWGKQEVALTVFLTLVAIVTVGSLLGSLLPIGLVRLGIDPAITSAPLVAALVDILGVLIYVLVAGLVLPA